MPDPNFGLPDETCQLTDPLFHVPNTYTGIGDFGGADFAVTMGGFDNAAGSRWGPTTRPPARSCTSSGTP